MGVSPFAEVDPFNESLQYDTASGQSSKASTIRKTPKKKESIFGLFSGSGTVDSPAPPSPKRKRSMPHPGKDSSAGPEVPVQPMFSRELPLEAPPPMQSLLSRDIPLRAPTSAQPLRPKREPSSLKAMQTPSEISQTGIEQVITGNTIPSLGSDPSKGPKLSIRKRVAKFGRSLGESFAEAYSPNPLESPNYQKSHLKAGFALEDMVVPHPG
jgi:hypothetical protein